MESDEEDFVFYGTPIEREEEITSRKKKAIAEASGQLRTLPPWKQEVRDEEGRRRFHGAFSGGFSAGYYNTVGSKEGWTPQSFTSSRKNRAEIKQQSIYNFLDEDERAELEGQSLGTSMQFDTFGFTAAEFARKQAEKEQQQRPSSIPGPVPEELVVPTTESIGVKLLLKMGWRRGRSIKDSSSRSLYGARREARKALLALSADNSDPQLFDGETESVSDFPTDDDSQFVNSTLAYVLNPKQDLHGLGYDPFKDAPEFREKKRSRISRPLSVKDRQTLSRRVGPGFGIGALEDLDAEDEDVYAPDYDFEETFVQEVEEPLRLKTDTKMLDVKEHGTLPGFKVASHPDGVLERFDPPAVPKDFVPIHKFSGPLEIGNKFADAPPPECPAPEDSNLKVLIEGVATLVARCGKLFEDLSREKNQSNPLFSFLNGGEGSGYYARKLWEACQKGSDQIRRLDNKMVQEMQKMTADSRGRILGEKALERTSKAPNSLAAASDAVNFQSNLSDTFTKQTSVNEFLEVAKPFQDDPAKQKRFEQFLKDKYQGGLRPKDIEGAGTMSEAARARERLEFEAAAEALEKGNSSKGSQSMHPLLVDLSATAGLQFTASGTEKIKITQDEEVLPKTIYPKREEFQWRPAPVLCKCFDLIDPYMGKPGPAPRARSKMESFMFMPDSIKTANADSSFAAESDSSLARQKAVNDTETAEKEIEAEVEVENVERPVDLYKAIFSDDSDDENIDASQVEDSEKKVEVANTTLNRLIAGDFLESLGKELGLAVPPELPPPENKGGGKSAQETGKVSRGSDEPLQMDNKGSSLTDPEVYPEGRFGNPETSDIEIHKNSAKLAAECNFSVAKGERSESEKLTQTDPKVSHRSAQHYDQESSSSDDDRPRKRSKRHHRHRSDSSDDDMSDSSDGHRDRYGSKSKRKKRKSSREHSSSRRKSKHHKHRSNRSPSRSHRRSEKHYEDVRSHGRRYRD